jgi:hypothetical protein
MANEEQTTTGAAPEAPPAPETPGSAPAPETAIQAAPPEGAITIPTGAGPAATDAAQSVPLAPPLEDAPPWLRRADWLLVGLTVALAFVVGSVPAYNSDIWMHLATGRMIAEGTYSFGTDPFSFATEATAGHDAVNWADHAWLYELGLYLLYSATGGVGVIIARSVIVVALAILLVLMRGRQTSLLVVAVCLALSVLTLSARLFSVQPVLVSALMLGIALFILHRAGIFETVNDPQAESSRSKVLWALPVLFVLWVNLDQWFVLGPITVGLCLAGAALQRWRGQGSQVCLRRLAAVFGVGLLTCVVSPFHVRGLQLPPELGYWVVRGADAIHVPVPDVIVGGGRTIATLREQEGTSANTVRLSAFASPLVKEYRTSDRIGFNVAGIALWTLLILGLAAFLMSGLASTLANGPPLHPGRFLIWLFFAALAVGMYRLIPFFAVVAAPLTALTLSELVLWYMRTDEPGTSAPPWTAPVRLVRLLAVPLMLILIGLAWPGWLNWEIGDMASPRHVEWAIHTDPPSVRQAAERLAELSKDQPNIHVFNTAPDFANHCAWLAPGVRCFIDGRLNLYADSARDYVTAKQALFDRSKPTKNWTEVFRKYGITHLVVENFLDSNPQYQDWWKDSDRWLEEYGDMRVHVFAWSKGEARWTATTHLERLNHRAFGPVAAADRPLGSGLPAELPEALGVVDRYFKAPPHISPKALQIDGINNYAEYAKKRTLEEASQQAPRVAAFLAGTGAYSTIYSPYVNVAFPFFTLSDFRTPAAPVLMMRLAWQGVAEAPDNERCYRYLESACKAARDQEQYWLASAGHIPGGVRENMRRLQQITALRDAAEVGSAIPGREYQLQADLAQQYLDLHYMDLAVTHMVMAVQILETMPSPDPKQKEEWRKFVESRKKRLAQLEDDVQKRKKKFNVDSQMFKSQIEKVRFALYGAYRTFGEDSKEGVDPQGLGLAQEALEMLDKLNPATLTEREKQLWLDMTLDLLFTMGRARQAAVFIDSGKDTLEQSGSPFPIYRAAVLGRYTELLSILARREEKLAAGTKELREKIIPFALTPPPLVSGPIAQLSLCAAKPSFDAPRALELNLQVILEIWHRSANEYFSIKTLRGLMALEAGDTVLAHRIFQEVLRESGGAGGIDFSDRPIAERYGEYLAKYQK